MKFPLHKLTLGLVLIVISSCCYAYGADLFTSTDILRDLSLAEDKVIPELNKVVISLEERINHLYSLVEDIKNDYKNVPSDLYMVSHPLHTYQVIKRWPYITDMFHQVAKTGNNTEGMKAAHDIDGYSKHQNSNDDFHLNERYGSSEKRESNSGFSDGYDEEYDGDQIGGDENAEADSSGQTKLFSWFSCKNNASDCEVLASEGYCMSTPSYMNHHCPHSCGVCAPSRVRDQADQMLHQLLIKMQETFSFPNFHDYDGAKKAIIRLQRTYSLRTEDLIQGVIQGYKSGKNLSIDDMFNIGCTAVQMDEWGYGAQWLNKARAINTNMQLDFNISLQLAQVYTMMGDHFKADKYLTLALEKHPLGSMDTSCYDTADDCPHFTNTDCKEANVSRRCRFSCFLCQKTAEESFVGEFELSNAVYTLQRKLNESGTTDQRSSIAEPNTLRSAEALYKWKEVYEALCRGEGTKQYPKSVCRYRPVGPMWNSYKEEILVMNPRISQVYDVITDKEADFLKTKAKTKMERAVVGSHYKASNIRVSNVGWLMDDEDPLVRKISERVALITGLEVTLMTPYDVVMNRTSSDEFQAVNYGIGGQYEPHVDYFTGSVGLKGSDMENVTKSSGDRIATFLLYLTDVKAGGATVYPKVKVRVPPVKNAAAFWFNARLSGKYDPLTLHAGCPVLLGEKWVCNKWVREYGNEFKRKCGLTETDKYT